MQLDDGLAEAHTSLALIAENYDYDWQTAEKEYRRAIQLDPNSAYEKESCCSICPPACSGRLLARENIRSSE